MKINDTQNVVGTPEANASPTPRTSDKTAPADTVTTQQRQKLEQAVVQAQAAASPGRAAEIQQIAAAVKNGTYAPDPSRIAERILDDAQLEAHLEAMMQ